MAQRDPLISKISAYVETYMNQFDGSHDFNHIKRVVGLSHQIASRITDASTETQSAVTAPPLDLRVITLSALLHDVGDKKYLKEGDDEATLVRDALLTRGADPALAAKIQTICLAVSYTSEVQDRAYVRALIARYPELAVVQDADRLDAIGAVGIGRVFTYGGAKTKRGMQEGVEMMGQKLFRLEAMMKTVPGREIARGYTERLRIFRGWWDEEVANEQFGSVVLGTAER